jgi:uncharacterized protein YkwD
MKNFLKGTMTAFETLGGVVVIVGAILSTFVVGYIFGFNNGLIEGYNRLSEQLAEREITVSADIPEVTEPNPSPIIVTRTPTPRPNWSGPELWEAVNARRQQLGVNALGSQAELCTVASVRLNELLELGKLDGHEGFSNMAERRPDLAWIFEKYNISEFLVSGAGSAQEAVDLWEDTLGHKKLLTGGEYVWGCTYAQNSFGVAIAAY